MAKRPPKTEQQEPRMHGWAVYHLKGTPAKFVGFVYNEPDERSAIERPIEEYNVRRTSAAGGCAAIMLIVHRASVAKGGEWKPEGYDVRR